MVLRGIVYVGMRVWLLGRKYTKSSDIAENTNICITANTLVKLNNDVIQLVGQENVPILYKILE